MLGAVVSLPLLLGGCGDQEQVKEMRWLAMQVVNDGQAVRLVTASSSSDTSEEVRVRMERAEVGLLLRLRVPEVRLGDLTLHCAEVKLSEPIAERRLLDDASGRFNPFGVSVEAVERLLREGEVRCVRVPAVPD